MTLGTKTELNHKMHKSGLTLADYRALCGIELAAKEILTQMGYLRTHISKGDIYGEELRLVFTATPAAVIYRLAKQADKRYELRQKTWRGKGGWLRKQSV